MKKNDTEMYLFKVYLIHPVTLAIEAISFSVCVCVCQVGTKISTFMGF